MFTQFKVSTLKKFSQKLSDFPWIQALFAIGVILRISGFPVGGIWYDELFSLEMTHQNLFQMINALKANITPPGWETLLWFVVHVFGWNAFSLRLPSVIASIATLWIMYKIGETLKFTRGQLIATMAVVALLPYQLISAQQGRVYALFSMFYLLGIYAALSKRWLVLGLSAAALFWGHNVSFMYVPGLFLIALIVHPENWKKVVLVFFLSGLSFVPWLGVTLKEAVSPIRLFPTFSYNIFTDSFLISLFGYNMPYWIGIIVFFEVLTLCLSIVFRLARWIYRDMRKDIDALKADRINIKVWVASLVAKKSISENSIPHYQSKWILFVAFAIPLFFLTAASLWIQNVIIFRTIYPLTIPLVMWLASFSIVHQPNIFQKILYGISIVLLLIGLISWAPLQPSGNFENLEYIFNKGFSDRYVGGINNIVQPGDAFFHDTGYTAILFKYYFPNMPNYLIDGNNVVGLKDIQVTDAQIPQMDPEKIPAKRLWVVWTREETISKINKTADDRTYQLITKYNCPIISGFYHAHIFFIEVYLCDLNHK